VGREWDLVQGELTWFGNLRTVFGIDSETFAGTIGDFLDYVHPGDRERVAEELEDARLNHKLYSRSSAWSGPTARSVGSMQRVDLHTHRTERLSVWSAWPLIFPSVDKLKRR
jgi:PAS fold